MQGVLPSGGDKGEDWRVHDGITERGSAMWNDVWAGVLAMLINGEAKVVRIPKLTTVQREIIEALDTLGYGFVAKDEDGETLAYTDEPEQRPEVWVCVGEYCGVCDVAALETLSPLLLDWNTLLDIKEVLNHDSL